MVVRSGRYQCTDEKDLIDIGSVLSIDWRKNKRDDLIEFNKCKNLLYYTPNHNNILHKKIMHTIGHTI